jgi:hypothetical protein
MNPLRRPRKSVRLGLVVAYDWSSHDIDDRVLIGKVLERALFEDVVRIVNHFGLPMVERVLAEWDFGPLGRATAARQVRNIREGMRRAMAGEQPAVQRPERDVAELAPLVQSLFERELADDVRHLAELLKSGAFTLDDVFSAARTFRPISDRDPERIKLLVSGLVPLAGEPIEPETIEWLKGLVNEHEIGAYLAQRG